MKKKGFDFGFAAGEDEEDDGQPEVKTVPAIKMQEFKPEASSKVRPAQYPNNESFL